MTLLLTVGDEFRIMMPPPFPEPVLIFASPFWTVNPVRMEARPSFDMNFTTESSAWPSMIVTDAPWSLATVMDLPEKLIFS